MAGPLDAAAELVAAALRPVAVTLGRGDADIRALAAELGFALPEVPQALRDLGATAELLDDALAGLEAAADDDAEAEEDGGGDRGALAAASAQLALDALTYAVALEQLPDRLRAELPPPFIAASGVDDLFVPRMLDHAIDEHLEAVTPLAEALLHLVGVLERRSRPADPARFQPEFVQREVLWERIPKLIADPAGLLREVYGWGTPALDVERLFDALTHLSFHLSFPPEIDFAERDRVTALSGVELTEDDDVPAELELPLLGLGPAHLGLGVLPLPPAAAGAAQPLALTLLAGGELEAVMRLSDLVRLELEGEVDVDTGLTAVLRPGAAPQIRLGAGGPPSVDGRAGVRLVKGFEEPEVQLQLMQLGHNGSVDAHSVYLRAAVELPESGEPDVVVEAGIEQGRLVFSAAARDGFLAAIIPPDDLVAEFDVGVSWSRLHGVRFTGSGGTEVTLPFVALLGPFFVDLVHLELAVEGDGIELVAAISGGALLGPITAIVERVGLKAQLRFGAGNLGRLGVEAGVAPPRGIGLAIDAGAVTGSGFLLHDPRDESYAGAVQLDLGSLALNAVGIITTRLPDGSKGFSLLVIVAASGFQPVQLGFGFTLNGIGGLLGINRTASVDALRAGVRTQALDGVLLAQGDPVARAPAIVSSLRTLFPPAAGRHVFGPMALLAWGTPTVLTFELAVILELPAPLRLIVLGRLRALLPGPDERLALVKLNLDAVGVVELDRHEASIDATLYDSNVAGFAISGDMALRASWGERPGFALAVGGFHPRFQPPPGFPALRRLTIALASTDNPRVRLEAYLALTSNTVQLGARLELSVEAAGFTLAGLLAFDALVALAPFGLEVDIAGSLALKRGGTTLMGVAVRIHLSGPAPWRASGEATFQLLFVSVTIQFSLTFGSARPLPPPEAVAVWPLLRAALEDAGSWGALPAAGERPLAVVRPAPAADGELLVHPLGDLAVTQRVVPLERELDRYAGAPPADFRRFGIESVRVGGRLRDHEATHDHFAPAQFQDLADDERLAAPGFDRMPAGVRVTGARVAAGAERPVVPAFETIVLGAQPGTPAVADYRPSAESVELLAESGAAAAAALRRPGRTRYLDHGPRGDAVKEPEFVVAARGRLDRVGAIPAGDGSFTSAQAALRRFGSEHPEAADDLQVVRGWELIA